MSCLVHQDRFPIVSVLVYVMYIGEDLQCIITQGYQLSWFTKLLYCMDSQPWVNIEFVSKSIGGLTYGWEPKVVIYPYRFGHYWWRLVVIGILNGTTMISRGIETMCALRWSKKHVIIKFMITVIPSVEFDICSLKLKYVNWSHNKWDL